MNQRIIQLTALGVFFCFSALGADPVYYKYEVRPGRTRPEVVIQFTAPITTNPDQLKVWEALSRIGHVRYPAIESPSTIRFEYVHGRKSSNEMQDSQKRTIHAVILRLQRLFRLTLKPDQNTQD